MDEIVVIDGEIELENTLDGEVELDFLSDLDPEVVINAGGGVSPTGTKEINITANGVVTENVADYASAKITTNVPASEVDSGTKNIATNGTHDVVGYANASVNVPNSYSAGDEGKVVSNGALVAQTSDTVTANDTYDTTLINSLKVNVSGGGGYTLADIAGGKPSGAVDLTGIQTVNFGMSGRLITSAQGYVASGSKICGFFFRCPSLVAANLILDDSMGNDGEGTFHNCANLETIVLICNGSYNNQMNTCHGDSKLKTADVKLPRMRTNFFYNCSQLDTLIIRNTSVMQLENAGIFNQSKFKNGGAGGTIYIPKALYDHLGDGTSSDYKAATNWSTVNGYGTITWKSIESTHTDPTAPIDLTLYYADGTAIPTT